MTTGLFGSLLIDAPFVVAEAVFASPKHRGFRLPSVDDIDPTRNREMFVRQRIRIHDARSRAQSPHSSPSPPPPTHTHSNARGSNCLIRQSNWISVIGNS